MPANTSTNLDTWLLKLLKMLGRFFLSVLGVMLFWSSAQIWDHPFPNSQYITASCFAGGVFVLTMRFTVFLKKS